MNKNKQANCARKATGRKITEVQNNLGSSVNFYFHTRFSGSQVYEATSSFVLIVTSVNGPPQINKSTFSQQPLRPRAAQINPGTVGVESPRGEFGRD